VQHPPDQEAQLLTVALATRCSHQYGAGPLALDDLDLELRPGVTGLVGVNGAGKSTLLSVLAGTLRPQHGGASIEGVSLYGLGRRRALARIGFMPQSFVPPPGATVLEVVSYLGWLRGLPARKARSAARQVVAEVGLEGRCDAPVRSLSGGMLRRVAFAQSIVTSPDVLLLDEPTTGLDPEQRAAIRAIVQADEARAVTVVSSHLMEDIAALAQHLVVIEQGRVVFDDSLARFQRRPGTSDEERLLRLLAEARSAAS